MPDWREIVRRSLGTSNLPPELQQEVLVELAAHMEDVYRERLAAGSSVIDAQRCAESEVPDWRTLRARIEASRQKETVMNTRTKQFWLPAVLSLFASMTSLTLLQVTSAQVRTSWTYAGVSVWPYAVWFLILPLIGAISSRISCRAGSRRTSRFAAVVFPSIVMSVVMSAVWLMILASFALRHTTYPTHLLPNFARDFFLWVILPGAALLLGTVSSGTKPVSC